MLDSREREALAGAAALAIRACSTPFAAVILFDRATARIVAQARTDVVMDLDPVELSLQLALPAIPRIERDTASVASGPDGSQASGSPCFFASMPFSRPDGEPVGAVCLFDPVARMDGNIAEDLASLRLLADQAERIIHMNIIARQAVSLARGAETLSLRLGSLRDAGAQWEEERERQRRLLAIVPVQFWSATPDGTVSLLEPVSGNIRRSMSSPKDRAVGVHPECRPRLETALQKSLATGEPLEVEVRALQRQGERWLRIVGRAESDASGKVQKLIGTIEDIDARHTAVAAQKVLNDRLELALDGNGIGVWEWDPATGRSWLAGTARRVGKLQPVQWEQPWASLAQLLHPDDLGKLMEATERLTHGHAEEFEVELRVRTDGGGWRWILNRGRVLSSNGADGTRRICGTFLDIDKQKRQQAALETLSRRDPVTGLTNRIGFDEALSAAASGNFCALAIGNIDGLQQLNSRQGYGAGDAAIEGLAASIQAVVPEEVIAAYLGGGEFALISSSNTAQELVRLLQASAVKAALSVSIGATERRDAPASGVALRVEAETALVLAKQNGSGHQLTYAAGMRTPAHVVATAVDLAWAALSEDRVVPHFQPKVHLKTGRVVGFEALLRLQSPEGVQGPAILMPAFEDVETARALGRRMLERVIDRSSLWRPKGYVAVNASSAELRQPDYAETLLQLLQARGLAPRDLQIEVTETVCIDSGAAMVRRNLDILHGAGVGIALDDFGTGFASARHLKELPISLIKIDRSFVAGLIEDQRDRAIVMALVQAGRGLALPVTAEGVETREQADLLAALGCPIGQGFYFGRPVPPEQL